MRIFCPAMVVRRLLFLPRAVSLSGWGTEEPARRTTSTSVGLTDGRPRSTRSGVSFPEENNPEKTTLTAQTCPRAPAPSGGARGRGSRRTPVRDSRHAQPAPGLLRNLSSVPHLASGTLDGGRSRGDSVNRSPHAPSDQLLILVTWPAPTVRPPSRMANCRPSSMAIGWISDTLIEVLSPGMTISVPLGRVTTPVTSVVRK